MSEKKPENKLLIFAKMAGVCVVCVGIVYGVVTLVTSLSS
jgi:uncharacterized membrane protein